ncbi:MAG: ZIP family metal transporter [Gemmatimonadetes bacterium]|nr:ZIP family metal transporter [Gemmatimonadota bacterium]MBK6779479.1 ZIP family metal transporter [Gemmatimonadota bacterium]MBK7350201.1 ZIP family metal transporter [Gemmatimonadota bacterium]MBK7716278.1 ZIP family metal transporter [Gemmatimonadota bacterium]MBK7785344.1 ZIP family metal transporter [Gemmatimonadota bacterium]
MNALVFALVAALGNLAGGWAVVRHERKSLVAIEMALAFGAGFMLSVALLEVAPEAIARDPGAPLYILLGYLAVHLAQHVLVPHFHFGEETHSISPRQGLTALAGLLLHTFFDGVAIASGFLVSGSLGLLLFLAVFLHKLPEGVAMASVMLAGGQSAGRALGASALLGVATVAGVLLTEVSAPLVAHGLAISAGVTLYVAASNLVPEFQARRGWAMPVAFFGGTAAFVLTRLLVEAGGH